MTIISKTLSKILIIMEHATLDISASKDPQPDPLMMASQAIIAQLATLVLRELTIRCLVYLDTIMMILPKVDAKNVQLAAIAKDLQLKHLFHVLRVSTVQVEAHHLSLVCLELIVIKRALGILIVAKNATLLIIVTNMRCKQSVDSVLEAIFADQALKLNTLINRVLNQDRIRMACVQRDTTVMKEHLRQFNVTYQPIMMTLDKQVARLVLGGNIVQHLA